VLAVAEARPDSRLLDVGHGVTALRLTPASLVLADGEGTGSLRPAEFASATPDPFCGYEDHWLRHLELAHRDVVGMLTRLLPDHLRGGHVRPLGLDRLGLRLRSRHRTPTTTCGWPSRNRWTRRASWVPSCGGWWAARSSARPADSAERVGQFGWEPPVAIGPQRSMVTRPATCPGEPWPRGTRPSPGARRRWTGSTRPAARPSRAGRSPRRCRPPGPTRRPTSRRARTPTARGSRRRLRALARRGYVDTTIRPAASTP